MNGSDELSYAAPPASTAFAQNYAAYPQLFFGATQAQPAQPATWQPSTWQPGQPGSSPRTDYSQLPMPTAEQIEQQRQAIYARLQHYGYQPVQLSDQQVLSTMTNLPQPAVQWPSWVEDFYRQHPEYAPGAYPGVARPGIDVPYDQTYTDRNLALHGLNPSVPTGVGAAYDMYPRAAQIWRYGNPAVEADEAARLRGMVNPRAITDFRTDYLVGSAPDFGGPGGASSNPADRAVMPPAYY